MFVQIFVFFEKYDILIEIYRKDMFLWAVYGGTLKLLQNTDIRL